MKKLIVIFILTFSLNVSAQSLCPRPYASNDRDEVKAILAGPISGVVSRARELALVCSFPASMVTLGLNTQRVALNAEYQALVSYLNTFVNYPPVTNLRPRSQMFLRAIINSQRLGFDNTTLLGATQQIAESNSQNANNNAREAVSKVWDCF